MGSPCLQPLVNLEKFYQWFFKSFLNLPDLGMYVILPFRCEYGKCPIDYNWWSTLKIQNLDSSRKNLKDSLV